MADAARGHDPAEKRALDRDAKTVKELCVDYMDKAEQGLLLTRRGAAKKPSTLYTDKGRIERHIVPLLGNRTVKDLTTADVRGFVRDVTAGKTAVDVKTKKRGRAIVAGGQIIDPYNELEASRPSSLSETEFVSQLISKCKLFGRVHDVTVVVVAHPTKLQNPGGGKEPQPGLYDISGSAHWRNKADAGIVVYRDYEAGRPSSRPRRSGVNRCAARFAVSIVKERGHVGPDAVQAVRAAGYDDGEIIEIVAHVALNTLTNYVNEVAGTAIDFPAVDLRLVS